MSQANTLTNYIPAIQAGTATDVFVVQDQINELFATGATVLVDGFTVVSRFGRRPASVFGNGTLTVTVKAKKAGAVRYLYFKVGSQVPTVAVA